MLDPNPAASRAGRSSAGDAGSGRAHLDVVWSSSSAIIAACTRLRHQHPGVLPRTSAARPRPRHRRRTRPDSASWSAWTTSAGRVTVQPTPEMSGCSTEPARRPSRTPVALVRGHQRPTLPGLGDPEGEGVAVQDPPVGLAGEFSTPGRAHTPASQLGQVAAATPRSRPAPPHRVCRVGHGRNTTRSPGPSPSSVGSRHQLLGADQPAAWPPERVRRPPPAAQVPDHGGPQLRSARVNG